MSIVPYGLPGCCGVAILVGFPLHKSEREIKEELEKLKNAASGGPSVKLIYLNHQQVAKFEKVILETGFTRIHDESYNQNSTNWIVGYSYTTTSGKSQTYEKKA